MKVSPSKVFCYTVYCDPLQNSQMDSIATARYSTDLLKFGLWVVEMRALNDLRELGVQTDAEVEHSSINLHLCRCGVTSQSRVMHYYHTLPEANNTCM